APGDVDALAVRADRDAFRPAEADAVAAVDAVAALLRAGVGAGKLGERADRLRRARSRRAEPEAQHDDRRHDAARAALVRLQVHRSLLRPTGPTADLRVPRRARRDTAAGPRSHKGDAN